MMSSFRISASCKKFILQKRYWLKIRNSWKLKINFFVFLRETNLFERNSLKGSFFQVRKFEFIFCRIVEKRKLCHSKAISTKYINKTRRIDFCLSSFAMSWKRFIKKTAKCFFELKIITSFKRRRTNLMNSKFLNFFERILIRNHNHELNLRIVICDFFWIRTLNSRRKIADENCAENRHNDRNSRSVYKENSDVVKLTLKNIL
jgi:hypothetical protein